MIPEARREKLIGRRRRQSLHEDETKIEANICMYSNMRSHHASTQ